MEKISIEEARRRADEEWSGVYLVSTMSQPAGDFYHVRLHGPGGPIHYLDAFGNIACHRATHPGCYRVIGVDPVREQ